MSANGPLADMGWCSSVLDQAPPLDSPGDSMRTREQLPTESVTVGEIMRSRYFTVGVADARAGRPFPARYEFWGVNDQESYERGRAWATVAPGTRPCGSAASLIHAHSIIRGQIL